MDALMAARRQLQNTLQASDSRVAAEEIAASPPPAAPAPVASPPAADGSTASSASAQTSESGSGEESDDEYFCDACAAETSDGSVVQQVIVGPRYTLRAAGEYDAKALAALCKRLGADEVEDVCQACFAAKLDAPSKALFSLYTGAPARPASPPTPRTRDQLAELEDLEDATALAEARPVKQMKLRPSPKPAGPPPPPPAASDKSPPTSSAESPPGLSPMERLRWMKAQKEGAKAPAGPAVAAAADGKQLSTVERLAMKKKVRGCRRPPPQG
jgi:hypothetical protein